jgi:hypothetical protein
MEELDLGVGQLDEDHRHAMGGFVLRGADPGAERVAVLRRRGLEVGHGDRHMVQSADHGRPFCRVRCGYGHPGAPRQGTEGRGATA